MDLNTQLRELGDRAAWAQRGASFMTKLRATKAVWFPPQPAKTGRKAAATVEKGTKRSAKKTTRTAKKATAAAK
jgi:hypothetical protein